MQSRYRKGQCLRLISQGCYERVSGRVSGVVAFQRQRVGANHTQGNDKQVSSVVVLGLLKVRKELETWLPTAKHPSRFCEQPWQFVFYSPVFFSWAKRSASKYPKSFWCSSLLETFLPAVLTKQHSTLPPRVLVSRATVPSFMAEATLTKWPFLRHERSFPSKDCMEVFLRAISL